MPKHIPGICPAADLTIHLSPQTPWLCAPATPHMCLMSQGHHHTLTCGSLCLERPSSVCSTPLCFKNLHFQGAFTPQLSQGLLWAPPSLCFLPSPSLPLCVRMVRLRVCGSHQTTGLRRWGRGTWLGPAEKQGREESGWGSLAFHTPSAPPTPGCVSAPRAALPVPRARSHMVFL